MNDQKGVTIRESVTVKQEQHEKFYSDDEIRDLFDDDADCLVIALLNRAQAADDEIERLREQRSDLTDRWECECASRDAEIERLKNQVAELQEEDER